MSIKADWSKILKKNVVRRTVAIHPVMDYYVRLCFLRILSHRSAFDLNQTWEKIFKIKISIKSPELQVRSQD